MSTADISTKQDITEQIAQSFTSSLHGVDVQAIGAEPLLAAGAFVARAAATRNGDESIVVIESLGDDARVDGIRRQRLAIINSDMPFLVDSIANALSSAGLVIHLLLHPILSIQRNAKGQATGVGDEEDARRESLIYIETDRLDAKGRQALARELELTLAQVRAAVSAWRPMIEAMLTDTNRLGAGEGGDLLRWFLKGNLTQIGYELRDRDLVQSRAKGIATFADEPLLSDETLRDAFAWFDAGHTAPLVIKSHRLSRVHRRVLIDLFIVPVKDENTVTALSIHAGLWASAALAAAPDEVPVLRDTLATLMARYSFDPLGHAGKTLAHALTALPHDLLLGLDAPVRERLVLTAMSLADRPRPRVELVTSALGRHLFAFVWLMRDDVSTGRREAIADMIRTAANAPLVGWSMELDDSSLALVRFTYDLRGKGRVPDADELDAQLQAMLRGWTPAVENALADLGEGSRAAVLAQRFAAGFPMPYRDGAGPAEAAQDILGLHALAEPGARGVRFYQNAEDGDTRLRVKIYSADPLVLSEAVPALENFGFRAIEELTTDVGEKGALGHIQRFVLERQDGGPAGPIVNRASIAAAALSAVLENRAENDRFAELIVTGGLDPADVVVLRALFRYLRQTGSAYGLTTVVDAMRRNGAITASLVALFHALHDPAALSADDAASIGKSIDEALEQVSAIDDDRILRLVRAVIEATLRTNAFTAAAEEALAFKLDSAVVPGLPKPLPWREIWVYSPRVEGIHLRAGPVARGGLRWSDRRDDFRTEVLGLMKAQRVKNAVIVPSGAKGGFYPKQLPNPALDRDAWMAEGTESYRIFIRSLLSVTDNIVKDKVVHPDGVVIRDGDDPYFVVAADKGTASFSDVANAIALERGFWLGDAFASGGSNGYDHKAMGITARGAWISVQRHFAEMGVDVQEESVRVIGVGDMSGDVFGNGMLLSKAIKLVAAFDHRHIFIDPNPDPAASWAERERLFKLPRSSWDDYDRSLISRGGGVFPRSLKAITLTDEMKAIIGTQENVMEPVAFISALLRAEADLLWFGGIGTYVKAASQNNADVGDAANDRLRVDGEELRVKVIGEGANLGVTQAGRIAFALAGGRINTDFIDNSAGVDCSDNEVNIKIPLNKEMSEGRLAEADRNALLVRMTDDVAQLVLADNRLQALGLSIAEAGGTADLASYVRLIETLEGSGYLDRRVEGLTSDQELLRRAGDGKGLTRPELAVLLSTAKLAIQHEIEASALAKDALATPDLPLAFPAEMRKDHAQAIADHQLRGEIIATKLANRIINRLGVILPFTVAEEEGCSLAELAAGFLVAERLFGLRALWDEIDGAAMPEAARLALYRHIASAMAAQIGDILRSLPSGTSPSASASKLADRLADLSGHVDELLQPEPARRVSALRAELAALGAPDSFMDRALLLVKMDGGIGLAQLAEETGADIIAITNAFTRIGEALGIDWLQSTAARMNPSDPWERLLVSESARELQQMRLAFLTRAGKAPGDAFVDAWLSTNAARVQQFRRLVARAQTSPAPSAAMIGQLTGQARTLLSH